MTVNQITGILQSICYSTMHFYINQSKFKCTNRYIALVADAALNSNLTN